MALTHLEERIVMAIGRHAVSISEIEQSFFMTRPSRSTILRTLRGLVRKKVLIQTGIQRGTKYEKIR